MINGFLLTLAYISLAIYVVSMIEVIGSYCLTKSYQNIGWDENIKGSLLLPPLAPLFAINSILRAKEQYASRKPNKYNVEESLLMYLTHHCKSLDQWYSMQRGTRLAALKGGQYRKQR